METLVNRAAAELMQGTLDLLVLKALRRDPMHGWGVSARIAEMSGGVFRIGQGSLYPALHRLERREWIMSIWRQTEKNRIAQFYELTATGHNVLRSRTDRWRLYAAAVDRVLSTE
jgi:PadR family transcriptional regulator, regulatory protein PadR